MPSKDTYGIREIKLTAALYASRPGVVKHLKATGGLPDEIHMGGAEIGLRLLIARRGADITLTAKEKLVYDAIVKEKRLPGGGAVLIEEEEKRSTAKRKPRRARPK